MFRCAPSAAQINHVKKMALNLFDIIALTLSLQSAQCLHRKARGLFRIAEAGASLIGPKPKQTQNR